MLASSLTLMALWVYVMWHWKEAHLNWVLVNARSLVITMMMGLELHELELVDQMNQRIEISKDVCTLWYYGNCKFDLALHAAHTSNLIMVIDGSATPLAPWHLRGISTRKTNKSKLSQCKFITRHYVTLLNNYLLICGSMIIYRVIQPLFVNGLRFMSQLGWIL